MRENRHTVNSIGCMDICKFMRHFLQIIWIYEEKAVILQQIIDIDPEEGSGIGIRNRDYECDFYCTADIDAADV